MTVETQIDRIEYDGNGTTVAFPFPYKFFSTNDLVVYLRLVDETETLQVFGANYSLSGVGLDVGGTVTMTVAPAVGQKLVIYRDPPLTQLTDYIEGDKFPAESHESALDKLTMLVQRISNRVARSLSLRITDGVTGGAFNANSNRISNLSDPINNQDAVTRNAMQVYVGGVISGATPIVDPDYGTLASGDQIRRRRGTTVQHSTFTGAQGEITIDTDKRTAVVHDGTLAGGYPLVGERGATMLGRLNLAEGATIASASTLTPGTDGNVFHVSGTTTINAIASIAGAGPIWLIFDAVLTFAHNANLVQLGGANVTTAVNDIAMVIHEGGGVWRTAFYSRAAGGAGGATIPTGTRMLFNQTTAPTGWTKETNAAFNNQALRLVTGTVGSGGATGFTTVFGSGLTTSPHTLTTSQIPAHTHDTVFENCQPANFNAGAALAWPGSSANGGPTTLTSAAGGGGGSHSHNLSLDLSYRDVIIAQAP